MTAAVIVAGVVVMELIALGLREAGTSRGTADFASLVVIVLLAQRALSGFPPDARSLAWARSAPTAAAAVLGGTRGWRGGTTRGSEPGASRVASRA